MTKASMPEPAVEVDKTIPSCELQYTLAALDGLPHGAKLITTAQAEAYAAAKVREALEEAIQAVKSCNTSGTIRSGTVDQCVEAIRVLIPN